jgi:hypothetical protein
MGGRPGSLPRCTKVRIKMRKKDKCWSMGLVYNPRELLRVTTTRPIVAGELHKLSTVSSSNEGCVGLWTSMGPNIATSSPCGCPLPGTSSASVCSHRSHRYRGKAAPTLFFTHHPNNVKELYSLRLQYRLQVS